MGHCSVDTLIKWYGHYSDDRLHETSKVWDQIEDCSQNVAKQDEWF
jgi:hypothetical protein